jgi:hypothetical protein
MAAYALDGCNDTFILHMSPRNPARQATTPPAIAASSTTALGVLALCACLLLGCGGHGSATVAAVSCFDAGTPKVARVHAHGLVALRASVLRVLPQRVGRLYEEGTAGAANAWSDADPAPPPVSSSALRPAGYEMRWIAPNGDDVAATVLSFSSAGKARSFMALATSTRCRTHGAQAFAARPPRARNLAWVNPDGIAEADVYLARGRRVYRVADAPANQQDGQAGSAELGRSFFTIDALACLLPGAQCRQTSHNVPA